MASMRVKNAVKYLGSSRTEEEALIRANFSPSYARSGQIKSTKGWQELMEKALPDKDLLKVHKEGLKAINDKGEIDYSVRHKYLESGYKIKNKEKEQGTGSTQLNQIIVQFNNILDDEDKTT